MIVTIHQPEHLPWSGFFDKMRQADVFVLLDTTQFAKDDFQNRNRIKTNKGPVWLTVPVYKKGKSEQTILDVEICNDRNWRNRCWSLIYQNYRDAPYFAQHEEFFQELYARPWSRLVDLNLAVIRYLARQLGLATNLVMASSLKVYERGPTNVNLTICRLLGADEYLSGAFGKQYLDEAQFAEHGIRVRYQDFQHPVYPQLWGDFVPNMSVIDLLFNCGDASLNIIHQANPQPILTQTARTPLSGNFSHQKA
jgi:hypothetical protein